MQICAVVSTNLHQRYRGFKPYTVDSKGRVAVQPAWRPAAEETLYLLFSNTDGAPILKVLTQSAYDERVAIVEASALPEAKKRRLLGDLAAFSREVAINDQGKLPIPKDLCEAANITADSEVVQVGREKHFEIWNRELWDRQMAARLARPQDDEEDLGIL